MSLPLQPNSTPHSCTHAHPEEGLSLVDSAPLFPRYFDKTVSPLPLNPFPGLDLDPSHASRSEIDLLEHDACTAEQAHRFAQAESVIFEHAGVPYELKAPSPEDFKDKILSREGFAFYKHPHGFWTCLRILDQAKRALVEQMGTRDITERELCNEASQLVWPLLAGKAFRNLFVPNFMYDLACYVQSPPRGHIWRGVAFKGYPTLDGRLFIYPDQNADNNDICKQQMDSFVRHVDPAEELIDGTIMKRWVVSGGMKDFPSWIRRNPVAVVGPTWFSSLGSRMGLGDFTHIRIASSNSFAARHDILRRIKTFLDQKSKQELPPVVLFHCGGSLACWMICKLFPEYPRSILLDVGQALVAWHLVEPWYNVYTWKRIYLKAMIENLQLEGLYRTLAGAHYEPWLESARR